jgi:thiol-disulfide isomerase/thioredoxin
MDSKVVIGIIAVLVIGLGAYGYSSNQKEAAMMEGKAMEEKAMEEKAMMEKAASAKSGSMVGTEDMKNMMERGYEVYEPSKLARAEFGKVILFFKASWCPSCRTLDADIKAKESAIPMGLTILEVDYDKYPELKQKYGVTMQHTLVQVDKDGNQIAKWSGGATLEDVVKNIK